MAVDVLRDEVLLLERSVRSIFAVQGHIKEVDALGGGLCCYFEPLALEEVVQLFPVSLQLWPIRVVQYCQAVVSIETNLMGGDDFCDLLQKKYSHDLANFRTIIAAHRNVEDSGLFLPHLSVCGN